MTSCLVTKKKNIQNSTIVSEYIVINPDNFPWILKLDLKVSNCFNNRHIKVISANHPLYKVEIIIMKKMKKYVFKLDKVIS